MFVSRYFFFSNSNIPPPGVSGGCSGQCEGERAPAGIVLLSYDYEYDTIKKR
jgi:hypothetical protein